MEIALRIPNLIKAPSQSKRAQKVSKAAAVAGPTASQELPPISKSLSISPKKKSVSGYHAAAKRVIKKSSKNAARATGPSLSVGPVTKRVPRRHKPTARRDPSKYNRVKYNYHV